MVENGDSPLAGSRVLATAERIAEATTRSRVLSVLQSLPRHTDTAYSESAIASVLARLADGYRQSALGEGARTLAGWIRSSWLFQWLTEEPDPEVIVIDLTETRTVGPVIGVLDRFVRVFDRARPTARSERIGQLLGRGFRERPTQFLGAALLAIVVISATVRIVTGTESGVALIAQGLFSLVALGGLRITDSWEELGNRRVVKLLVAVLEPPEPPAEHEE